MNYRICPECDGKGSVEREVYIGTMNCAFADIDVQCPTCHGEGEVAVEDTFPVESPRLISLTELQIERDEAA